MYFNVVVPEIDTDWDKHVEIPERATDSEVFLCKVRNCVVNVLKMYEDDLPDVTNFEGFQVGMEINSVRGLAFGIGPDYQDCTLHSDAYPLIEYIDLFYSEGEELAGHEFRFYPRATRIKDPDGEFRDLTGGYPVLRHTYHATEGWTWNGVSEYESVMLEELGALLHK